ncbi:MAG: penicillin-binding protein 2 [Bacteroidaceae bacterium]|nr:penicillin-binding protein 2 [Bacteroidaceae bacterium]
MRKDYNLEKRKYVIAAAVVAVVAIYIVRLFVLQVGDNDYKQFADSNAFQRKVLYPSRGFIYDRNGELLVYNQPAYDVMMIPREMRNLDTLDFCQTLGIEKEQFDRYITDMKDRRKNPGYSTYTPQVFMTQLSARDYGRLQEKLYRYPGVYIQNRVLREYSRPIAANVLGNIREVSPSDIERDDYYRRGDYTGDLGVEKSFEEVLRGYKGEEILLRDAYGRIKGKYEDGRYDVQPISGRNITLSIDADLQAYGEKLMQNKTGAIVAIEPSTGEILALVSSPTYDPSMLVGRERGRNYAQLTRDLGNPLYDRAIMAVYPPGSTFKPTQGLIFLEENIITPNTLYPCTGGFVVGGLRVGCHAHPSPLPLIPSLATSCNAYYCYGLRSMLDNRTRYSSTSEAFEIWKNHLVSMGYGYKLGIDLPGEKRGFLPNSAYYDKFYGKNRWKALTIISIAIGQGEILATPLQIANLAATIANRGYFYTPHVVKAIQDSIIDTTYTVRRRPTIDIEHYDAIVEGMRKAVLDGTCRTANLDDIEVCGKTGTAQNPHGRDHSAFMGFAPMDKPQIAIAVYVENAGFGATYGVPIGSLMMEYYLKGEITDPARKDLEQRMFNSKVVGNSGKKR